MPGDKKMWEVVEKNYKYMFEWIEQKSVKARFNFKLVTPFSLAVQIGSGDCRVIIYCGEPDLYNTA